jgi:hypothetical protein
MKAVKNGGADYGGFRRLVFSHEKARLAGQEPERGHLKLCPPPQKLATCGNARKMRITPIYHGQRPFMSDEYEDFSAPINPVIDKLDEINLTLVAIRRDLPHLKFDFWGAVWFFLAIMFFVNWEGSKLDRWTNRVWYSLYYNARWGDVDINKRPLDCDFLHAPIGNKGCSYKKSKLLFTDSERQQQMQQATTPEERAAISAQPNRVMVYWGKKQD